MLALLLVSGSLSAQTQGAIKRVCHVSRFELAVACIKKYEGLHGPKHHPYVGYGHKLLPGEKFSPRMSERQADALLRSDLRKLCAMFRGFGRDSLLLAALAYNVGCGKVISSTPSASTASPPERMPAVSMSRSSTPPQVTVSSTVSRVVPAISVTMARS